MSTIADLIQSALDGNPSDTQQSFHALMMDKIKDQLEAKRAEMTDRFYNVGPEDPEDEEEQEVDVDEYDEDEVEVEDSDEETA